MRWQAHTWRKTKRTFKDNINTKLELAQRDKDKHRRSVFMLSDVLGTHTGNSSICHQWCATWFVLFSLSTHGTGVKQIYQMCIIYAQWWGTQTGNLSIFHQWCATGLVLFSRFLCLLLAIWINKDGLNKYKVY